MLWGLSQQPMQMWLTRLMRRRQVLMSTLTLGSNHRQQGASFTAGQRTAGLAGLRHQAAQACDALEEIGKAVQSHACRAVQRT